MLASYNLQSTFSGFAFYDVKWSPWIIGGILAVITGWCLLGGGSRIVKVTSTLVPIMGVDVYKRQHQDSVCAKGIARFLTRQGYDVWIDVDKLVVGQSWANNINEALQTADMMIALISKNSVRRMEVLREISEALDRNEKDENFYVLFVVIGNVHPSWFPDTGDGKVKKIIECLQVIQFIQLDAKGTISIAKMQELILSLIHI